MLKEINRNDILNVLRQKDKRFSRYPNSCNVITIKRQEWNEEIREPESFDVEVRFTYPNYIHLIYELYDIENGMVKDGNIGIDVFSLVPRIKTIVKQLEEDGYLKIYTQKCSFSTDKIYDYDSPEEHDYFEHIADEYQMRTGDVYKRYTDAEKDFSKDEHYALDVAIILTTKGQSRLLYLKEDMFSEPIGSLSLFVSIIAVLLSLF